MKELIVFDLDGTLAESKSSLDPEMSALLYYFLGIVKAAVISGGNWPQFEKQLLRNLPHDEHLMNLSKRKKIKAILDTFIAEFSVRPGGATSIDITKHGIDKAYGIRKLRGILNVSLKKMIFTGDALFPGGNDYPVEEAGVVSIPVQGPSETKRVIEAIIACLGPN